MKISDYLEKYSSRSVRGRNTSFKSRTASAPFTRFEKILSSCRLSSRRTKEFNPAGLTVSDYLANPIRTLYFGKIRDTPSPKGRRAEHAESAFKELSGYTDTPADTPDRSAAAAESKEKGKSLSVYKPEGTVPADAAETSEREKIDRSIKKAAARYDLPAGLIKGVIKAESDFNVKAVSAAGARGLMQLMPGTAEELGVKAPFDIDQNIDGGSRYLKKMLDLFDGDLTCALAAYNAGPGTVKRYQGIPPYRETKNYVRRVMQFSGQLG